MMHCAVENLALGPQLIAIELQKPDGQQWYPLLGHRLHILICCSHKWQFIVNLASRSVILYKYKDDLTEINTIYFISIFMLTAVPSARSNQTRWLMKEVLVSCRGQTSQCLKIGIDTVVKFLSARW